MALNQEQIKDIIHLRQKKRIKFSKIAEKYKVTPERIRQICLYNGVKPFGITYKRCTYCFCSKHKIKYPLKNGKRKCVKCAEKDAKLLDEVRAGKRWSKKYTACVECGKIKHKNWRDGVCFGCQTKVLYKDKKYKKYHQQKARESYARHRDKRLAEMRKRYHKKNNGISNSNN